ncbi:MAG: hypothetical protein FRX48_07682 [Lasallia pustulata]|uniref:SRP9 domain-containing protein n=1 Tax=Lasallia pustulata TaxID=136370 RepID=A0A5M8PI53_9LECA|nr:MAG: hypothetical protein FRX48_07682 [Lasallia pustulata]
MPYLPTAQSWLHQSTLLLQARPTTTRITTKYTLEPSTRSPSRKRRSNPPAPTSPPTPTAPQPKAHLILKTYDPVSGACLKYRTDKAAEVGRLMAALGRCGRVMAALPERAEEVQAQPEKVVGEGAGTGRSTPVAEAKGAAGEKEKGKGEGGRRRRGRSEEGRWAWRLKARYWLERTGAAGHFFGGLDEAIA